MKIGKNAVCRSAEEFGSASGLPFSRNTAPLLESVAAGGIAAPSRIVYQPMEGCDGEPDGSPGELTVRRYSRFAAGGPGIVWFEAVAVMPEGRANPRQLSLTEKNIGRFSRLVGEIKETAVKSGNREPLVIMQATHSGRYSKPRGTPEPLAARRAPVLEAAGEPTVVTDEYLDRVGEALVASAALAERAGFDGVDVKSCHGYLLSDLLAARDRPGRYGGPFENRTRLLLDAVRGVRAVCSGRFAVASRLNVYDGREIPDGFGVGEDGEPDFDEPARLCSLLSGAGADIVNVTMGNPYFNPHVNRPFANGSYDPPEAPIDGVRRILGGAAEIKKAVPALKVVASGLSFLGAAAPGVAAAYIGAGAFDFAGFGREAIAYPDIARDIASGRGADPAKICLCCSKCTEIMRKPGGTPGCVVRDAGVYLPIYKKLCGKDGQK